MRDAPSSFGRFLLNSSTSHFSSNSGNSCHAVSASTRGNDCDRVCFFVCVVSVAVAVTVVHTRAMMSTSTAIVCTSPAHRSLRPGNWIFQSASDYWAYAHCICICTVPVRITALTFTATSYGLPCFMITALCTCASDALAMGTSSNSTKLTIDHPRLSLVTVISVHVSHAFAELFFEYARDFTEGKMGRLRWRRYRYKYGSVSGPGPGIFAWSLCTRVGGGNPGKPCADPP